jgi:hypothetical protein
MKLIQFLQVKCCVHKLGMLFCTGNVLRFNRFIQGESDIKITSEILGLVVEQRFR